MPDNKPPQCIFNKFLMTPQTCPNRFNCKPDCPTAQDMAYIAAYLTPETNKETKRAYNSSL